MELSDIFPRLKDVGLTISQLEDGPCQNGYYIKLAKTSSQLRQLARQRISTNNSPVTLGNIACWICPFQDRWIFRVWECVPGPDESDFVCIFSTLYDALAAVFDFYFGQPTIIDGWSFPLHRHPELDQKAACEILPQAIHITPDAFETIAAQRRAQFTDCDDWDLNAWTYALQSQFLTIHHTDNESITLRVRRDLQEVYIVHEDEQPPQQ